MKPVEFTHADRPAARAQVAQEEARPIVRTPAEGTLRSSFSIAPARTSLLLLAILVAGAHIALALGLRTLYRPALPRWQAALYWVDYGEGFVRRGLPGEVLSLAVGTPTSAEVTVFGLTLTGAAICSLLVLAVLLARGARSTGASLLVFAVVATSPFTLALVAWDPGRFDDVGVVVLAGLALAGRCRAVGTRRHLLLVAISVAMAVSVACEEFLVVLIVPVACLALRKLDEGDRSEGGLRPWTIPLLTAVPAVTVAVASLVIAVPDLTVRTAFAEARQAGISITERPWTNGVVVLDRPLGEALAFVETLSPWNRTVVPLVFAVLYLCGAGLVWRALDRPAPRLVAGLTIGYGAVAVALGLVGVDYRRWWALAFIALLGSMSLLAPGQPGPDREGSRRGRALRSVLIVAVVSASVGAQLMPLYPTWDPALGGELPPAVRVVAALTGFGGG